MSSFESYDFASNPAWNKIESSLEIPPQLDRDAVILKRKKKFYKQNVDPTYNYDDVPLSSRTTTSSTSSSEPEQAPGGPRTSSTSQSQYQAPPNQQTYEQYNGPLRSTTTGTTHPMWSSSLGIILTYFQLLTNIIVLCCILMYILSFIAPLLGWDVDVMQSTWYGRALKGSTAACIIHILRTHGRPHMDKEYGRVLLLDETTHFLFLSLILLTSSPFILGLLPIGIRALVFTCQSFKIILPKYVPALWNVLSDPITKITSRASEWTRINATLEVTIGLSLILQLITPFRNFMLLFIYWQYLRMRYMLSYDTQRAFAEVRVKIDEYTQHPRCPTFIRTAWLKLYGFVCNLVDPQQQQQQQQMPKCTIM